jgi:Amt family ammonium transporter
VVLSVLFVDRMGVDDPVGAISVHGVCGVWGTLAAAIFNIEGFTLGQLGVQALGAAAAFLWTFPTAYLTFRIIHATVGLRVSPEEEMDGLDLGEHGESAYPDFALVAGVPAGAVPKGPAGGKAYAPASKPAHAKG